MLAMLQSVKKTLLYVFNAIAVKIISQHNEHAKILLLQLLPMSNRDCFAHAMPVYEPDHSKRDVTTGLR